MHEHTIHQHVALHLSRLRYTLGRVKKTNFTLSEEERSALDVLGIGGLVAKFRSAGRAGSGVSEQSIYKYVHAEPDFAFGTRAVCCGLIRVLQFCTVIH